MRSLAIAVSLLSSLAPASAAGAPLPSGDDFRLLATLHSPAISPDGKSAALVVSTIAWDDDRRTRQLVAIDLATGVTHVLNSDLKDLAGPAFSPDGSRLAFLAQDGTGSDAHIQVFVTSSDGGLTKQVTHGETDVKAFVWRPDGHALAFSASDPQAERKGADRFRDSFVFTTEPIVAREKSAPVHLFLLNVDDETASQLTFGPQSVADGSAISWSPDGKQIAFTLCRDAISNDQSYSHVAVIDVASKNVRALTGRTMWEGDPLFSPDGAHIAYMYSNGDPQVTLTNLYVTTAEGGRGTPVTASIDRPVGDAVWASDSKSLIVTAPDRTTNALYRVGLEGATQRFDLGTLVPGLPLNTTGGADVPSLGEALAKDGTLVFLASSPTRPPELYERSPSGSISQLTNFNGQLSAFSWASATRITFPTTTRVTADGVLYLPPGFSAGRKYPLVVYIHGGPGDASMLAFDFWAQVMAARGWLVLRPNYRGSPNLGLRYQRAILYDPEAGPGKDVMAALATVRARDIVDDSRIAVCGWSYGGIMTAWMISKYHFWKVAVSGASVNDWITDYGTADDSLADADLFHGSPFTGGNAAEWRRDSAITYARNVTTPVLILSDVGDNRDTFATSSMYWRALRDNGKDATLRVWPIEGHFPDDPVRIADVFHYWIDFIEQHFR